MRIELTTSAWKAEVLPLNYTRINKQRHRVDFYYVTTFLTIRQENMKILRQKTSYSPYILR